MKLSIFAYLVQLILIPISGQNIFISNDTSLYLDPAATQEQVLTYVDKDERATIKFFYNTQYINNVPLFYGRLEYTQNAVKDNSAWDDLNEMRISMEWGVPSEFAYTRESRITFFGRVGNGNFTSLVPADPVQNALTNGVDSFDWLPAKKKSDTSVYIWPDSKRLFFWDS